MIGYYVHHRGSGHLHRAMAIADALDDEVTILSSASRPSTWNGGWVPLPLDTDIPPVQADAGGALHWAPVGSAGLASRMSRVSTWLSDTRPSVVVVDVSVEIASLVRLHGVRVVLIAQPGRRGDDAHSLGYRLADAVIGCWPTWAHPLSTSAADRVEAVGGLSRIALQPRRSERSAITVLTGTGGRGESALDVVVATARAAMPAENWVVLSGDSSRVVADALARSAVVFGHCGQNAVAEIAAARVPAVFVAEERPFDEQSSMASVLSAADLPVRVISADTLLDWNTEVQALASDSGDRWAAWVDGGAAARAAAIIKRVANDRAAA